MGSSYKQASISISTGNMKKQVNKKVGLWCRVQGGRYRRCQETGNLLRDWRFGHAWWKKVRGKCNWEAHLVLVSPWLSFGVCLPVHLAYADLSTLIRGWDRIRHCSISQWLTKCNPQSFPRWILPDGEFVETNVLLATFDVIMLKHWNWRKATNPRAEVPFCDSAEVSGKK